MDSSLRELLPESAFQKIFPIMNPSSPLQTDFATCDGKAQSVATYEGLIEAATHFPEFAATGDEQLRKRELAAFFANVAQETTGAWAMHTPAEAAQWGLCFVDEGGGWYQSESAEYPAVAGQSYHGRGPLQLSYNHNYGRFSEHYFGTKDVLLNDPAQVLSEPGVFWGSAIFFWMSEDVAPGESLPGGEPSAGGLDGIYYKPSCHMAMTETWTPRASDEQKKRTFGLGVAINVINGGLECGGNWNAKSENRVLFYEAYAGYLSVPSTPTGWLADDYLTCKTQTNFSQP